MERTLEEVGVEMLITRERVRCIEAKAIRKLRHPSRSRTLKSFVVGFINKTCAKCERVIHLGREKWCFWCPGARCQKCACTRHPRAI